MFSKRSVFAPNPHVYLCCSLFILNSLYIFVFVFFSGGVYECRSGCFLKYFLLENNI